MLSSSSYADISRAKNFCCRYTTRRIDIKVREVVSLAEEEDTKNILLYFLNREEDITIKEMIKKLNFIINKL